MTKLIDFLTVKKTDFKKTDIAVVSIKVMAKSLGYSENEIRIALRNLKAKGFFHIEKVEKIGEDEFYSIRGCY